jgi:hypothetical protein
MVYFSYVFSPKELPPKGFFLLGAMPLPKK